MEKTLYWGLPPAFRNDGHRFRVAPVIGYDRRLPYNLSRASVSDFLRVRMYSENA